MRYYTAEITEFSYPEFTVKVSDQGREYLLAHVLFAANGSQDRGTFYPGVGDLVTVISFSEDENYILGGVERRRPRIDKYTATNIDDDKPACDFTLSSEVNDEINSKDPVTFICGDINKHSCTLAIDGNRLNLILTKPGDLERADGWLYYDVPFFSDHKTEGDHLLAGLYDAFNVTNLYDLIASDLLFAGIVSSIGRRLSRSFAFTHVPVSFAPFAGQFHAHPVEVILFTPIRFIWNRSDS